MADIKAKITQAALSAITYDSEMAEYYSRKTGQGKHPSSVLNAVKFKLICRISRSQKGKRKKKKRERGEQNSPAGGRKKNNNRI